MNYIDRKYLLILSNQLNLFKDKGNDVYTFRCPLCDDSKKNKLKTRGYLYLENKTSAYFYKCHNCHEAMSFSKFIERVSPGLFKEYKLEKYRSNHIESDLCIVEKDSDIGQYIKKSRKLINLTVNKNNDILNTNCISLFNLDKNHVAVKYLQSREIPKERIDTLYYIDDIRNITSKIIKYKDTNYPKDSAIIIPFRDADGKLEVIQLRLLNTPKLRYITLYINNSGEKIYGREFIDPTKPVYVLEGPIDSMFVDNAIACAGASLLSYSKYLHEMYNDVVFLFDVDYIDNKDVLKQLQKGVDANENVVIYDQKISNGVVNGDKDINDIVLRYKYTKEQLMKYLKSRTFMGIKAKIELSKFNLKSRERESLCQSKETNLTSMRNRLKISTASLHKRNLLN